MKRQYETKKTHINIKNNNTRDDFEKLAASNYVYRQLYNSFKKKVSEHEKIQFNFQISSK